MKTRSQLYEERKQRRTRILVSVGLVALMVFSTIGYLFTGTSGVTRYNGFKVVQVLDASGQIQGYTANVHGKTLNFYGLPQDSLAIGVPPGFIDALQRSQAVIFLFDPADNQTQLYDQLRFDLQQSMAVPQGAAILNASSDYPTLPVGSCANATPQYMFIELAHGNRSITYNGGCFVMAGEGLDFALLRDRLVYAYNGITTS